MLPLACWLTVVLAALRYAWRRLSASRTKTAHVRSSARMHGRASRRLVSPVANRSSIRGRSTRAITVGSKSMQSTKQELTGMSTRSSTPLSILKWPSLYGSKMDGQSGPVSREGMVE